MSWTPNNGIYMDAYYNLVYPKGSTHLDGIDKDAMEVIDDHWGQFPPQHPLVGHIVGIAYIILWMINLFGNGSVCYIFIKVQNTRSFDFYHQQSAPERSSATIMSNITDSSGSLSNGYFPWYLLFVHVTCCLFEP